MEMAALAGIRPPALLVALFARAQRAAWQKAQSPQCREVEEVEGQEKMGGWAEGGWEGNKDGGRTREKEKRKAFLATSPTRQGRTRSRGLSSVVKKGRVLICSRGLVGVPREGEIQVLLCK